MKSYILAARPKTLPAAIVPVWVGCVLAFHLRGVWYPWLALWTLLGAIFIQIATNFFNDAIDADKGADTDARIGPARATASGQLPRNVVIVSALTCLLVAAVFGWLLYQSRGWPILAIGIPSMFFAYGYTGGPVPLAYKGLGEWFVILFFGLVAVSGTVFVQTGEWLPKALVAGLAIGCLSATLISINNLRDVDEDRGNGKNTLAVIWGRQQVLWLLAVFFLLPYVTLPFLLGCSWKLLLFLPVKLLACIVFFRVCKNRPSKVYNTYLAMAALHLVLFAAALHLVVIL